MALHGHMDESVGTVPLTRASAMNFFPGFEWLTMPADATVASAMGTGAQDDGAGFGITVTLNVSLFGLSKAKAEELAKRGHVSCSIHMSSKGMWP